MSLYHEGLLPGMSKQQGLLRDLLVGSSALFLLWTSQCVLTHSNVTACLAVLMLAAMQL